MKLERAEVVALTGDLGVGGERRLAFGAICALTLLTAAFYREFSYIRIPVSGLPLYVTELFIASCVCLLAHEAFRLGRARIRAGAACAFAALFLLWSAVCYARGRHDGLIALREFAIGYYALLYILTVSCLLRERDVHRLWSCIVLGTTVACVVVGWHMLTGVASMTSTGALRFHAPIAVGAAGVMFWCLASPAPTQMRRYLHVVGAISCAAVIVLVTQHRSAAVALAVSVLAWVVWFQRGRAATSIGAPVILVKMMVVGVGIMMLVPELARVTLERLQTIGSNTEEFNSAWRLLYWAILLERTFSSPIVGFGFGDNAPVFHFRGETYGDDLNSPAGVHNSFLFIFYKEGLVGVALIAFFLALVFRGSHRIARAEQHAGLGWSSAAAASALTFVCVFACFNVVLEGPYMGIFFWIYAALATGVPLRQRGAEPVLQAAAR